MGFLAFSVKRYVLSKLCSFVFSDSVSNGGIHTCRSVEVDFGDVMGVYSLNFSFNQQYLVAGCGNGAIQVYLSVS